MTRVAAFVPDLIDRSRVETVCRSLGARLDVVDRVWELPAAVGEGAGLVIVDLQSPEALRALEQLRGVKTIGFAPHVDRDLLRAARSGGCSRVMARSAFFSRLPELLSG